MSLFLSAASTQTKVGDSPKLQKPTLDPQLVGLHRIYRRHLSALASFHSELFRAVQIICPKLAQTFKNSTDPPDMLPTIAVVAIQKLDDLLRNENLDRPVSDSLAFLESLNHQPVSDLE